MRGWAIAGLLLAAVASGEDADQAFRLAPGDFRWVPFTVKQVPTSVDCRFDVVQGEPKVHVELLPMSEFRLFSRGLEHSTMAVTPMGRTGAFRQMIAAPGQYALVAINDRGAGPASITLHFATSVNPNGADVARTLDPGRRLAVILISFAVFIVTVTWSSRTLIRAMRSP